MDVVSVIIPTYNSAPTLGRAIDSLLSQTRPADEIIVVNDGSTDDTEALVARDYPQVRYHYQANAGLAATRNAGAALATGTLLALLDSDDEWVPTKLERQLQTLQAHPEFCGVGCHRIRVKIDAQGTELWRQPSRHADGALEEISFARELWSNRICGATMMIRREIFDRFGGYDAALRALEDHDLWLRLLGGGERLAVLREPLYIFYERPGSLRSNVDLLEKAWTVILAKWDPQSHSEAASLLTPREYAKVCKWWWLKLTFHALRLGDRPGARRYADRAAAYSSGSAQLELAGLLARHCPAAFSLLGKAKGFPRPTG